MSALYAACNRGKRCIAVDVQTDDGRDIVRRLAQDADVFVQNFRPGTLDRHGLGPDDLRAGHDDLVYVSLSGFGATGPYADKSAYDTVIQAYGGFGANQADPADGIPVFLRQTAADKVTAFTAAQAITAALLARERGHGGQHVELSMLDAVVSFLWADAAGNEVLMDSDGSRPSSFVATFRPFRFLDGFGIATPTSDDDFVGIMRAVRHRGRRRPTASRPSPSGSSTATWPATMMNQCYDVAETLTTDAGDGAAERAAGAVRRGAVGRPSSSTTSTRRRSACSWSVTTMWSDGCGSPATRSCSRELRPSSVRVRPRSASTPTRSSPRSASATASADLRTAGVVA